MSAPNVLPAGSDRTPPNEPTRHVAGAKVRRVVVGAAVAAITVVGGLSTGAAPASAAPAVVVPAAALATNAMAPVVTSSARQALDSYDAWTATQNAGDYRTYVWLRTQTAQYAATELGYPRDAMVEAWASTPIDHQRAVLAAMTQIGVPYRTNTSQEGIGFDCSGLTTYAWGVAGVTLQRQSGTQIRNAVSLDRSAAKAGDLVQYPGHVMLYLGVGDAIIHSVMTGRTVELDTISGRRVDSVRFGDPAA